MTHRPGVAGGHDVAARWCALAEQRLEYLTEMFESGRWRRFYSERALLENIKEAKRAVETWRGLSASAPIEGLRTMATSSSVPTEAQRSYRIELKAAPPTAEPTPIDIPDAAPAELAASDDLPRRAAVDMLALESALGISDEPFDMSTIERRYPLLRNSL